MGDWGIKISEEGYDVKTATDQQLILSSSFNALKVKMVGTTTTTVAHGLSYIPIFFAMCVLNTSTKWGIVGQNYYGTVPSIDATNFHPSGGNTKYYIFYQPGVV